MLSLNAFNVSLINCLKSKINENLLNKRLIILKAFNENCLKTSLRVCHSNENSLKNENIFDTNNNDSNDSNSERNESSDIETIEPIDYRIDLNSNERRIAKTFREHRLQQRLQVEQPSMPRLARVVLVGSPNAGKSTLTNQLIKRKVSSVSSKVHTTRHRVIGIISEDDIQVELLDTPGVVTSKHCSKHKLESTFMSDPLSCADAADIIAVLSDASNVRERDHLNPGIIRLLERNRNKESILILNKIDKIREKRNLLDITTRLTGGVVGGVTSIKTRTEPIPDSRRGLEKLFQKTEIRLNTDFRLKSETETEGTEEEINERVDWNRFSQVFMTSALSGDGIEDIRQYLMSRARFRPWMYHRSQVTDQSPQELVKTTIRGKFLDLLREEIPYKMHLVVNMWHLDASDNLFISVDVLCPKRFQSLVIGPKGQTIASIVQTARESLSNTFHCDISLKLIVKGIKNQ